MFGEGGGAGDKNADGKGDAMEVGEDDGENQEGAAVTTKRNKDHAETDRKGEPRLMPWRLLENRGWRTMVQRLCFLVLEGWGLAP